MGLDKYDCIANEQAGGGRHGYYPPGTTQHKKCEYRCDNLTTKKTIFVISHSDEASEGSVGSDSRSCKGTQYSPVPVTNLKGNGSTTIMHPIGYEHFNIYTHGFWGLYDSMGSTSDIYNQLKKHDGVK